MEFKPCLRDLAGAELLLNAHFRRSLELLQYGFASFRSNAASAFCTSSFGQHQLWRRVGVSVMLRGSEFGGLIVRLVCSIWN